jgi:hypothetical protein
VPLIDSSERVQEALAIVDAPEDIPAPVDIPAAPGNNLQWDPSDYQVRDMGGNIVGRVKPMHVDTPKEAVSCYCRLHACSIPLMRIGSAPPIQTYVEWLHRGRALPFGAAGKHAHQKLWRDMLRDRDP